MRVTAPERFHIPATQMNKVLHPLDEKIQSLELSLRDTWMNHFAGPVAAAIQLAISILATEDPHLLISCSCTRLVRALVSERRAICLMPDVAGKMHGAVNADTDAKSVAPPFLAFRKKS